MSGRVLRPITDTLIQNSSNYRSCEVVLGALEYLRTRERLTFDCAFHRVHHEGDGDEQGDDLLCRPGETRNA